MRKLKTQSTLKTGTRFDCCTQQDQTDTQTGHGWTAAWCKGIVPGSSCPAGNLELPHSSQQKLAAITLQSFSLFVHRHSSFLHGWNKATSGTFVKHILQRQLHTVNRKQPLFIRATVHKGVPGTAAVRLSVCQMLGGSAATSSLQPLHFLHLDEELVWWRAMETEPTCLWILPSVPPQQTLKN